VKLSLIKAIYTDTLASLYSRSEAENMFYIVLENLEKKSKIDVLVGSETLLKETYMDILVELNKGVPVQYLTQVAFFYDLELYINDSVLIPRPETEQLVHLVLQQNQGKALRLLDVGTGSGCIALALKKNWPNATIHGCDVSLAALEVARSNKKKLALDVHFFAKDILIEEIENYDIIVSNPPYIAQSEKQQMHVNVLDHEPHLALFVKDKDPLLFYKRIIALACLQKAICYFETSEFYRTELELWLNSKPLTYIWELDFQGKDRILKVTPL
jgi:release factor glutamine methyltransferase